MKALVVALAVVAPVAGVAYAKPGEPIVLVSTDAAFGTALDDALVPAGMNVVTVGDVAPPSIAELSAESRQLADREHATATVWLLPAAAGATLVTYDRHVDRLLVRELPYPSPLSATQAAEAARMVRTMLRALRVTPESDQPTPHAVAPSPPQPAPWLAASIGVGAWFAAPAETGTLAGNASLVWQPHGIGVALTGAFASSADVMTPAFNGDVSDVVVALEGRWALAIMPRIRIAPAAGLSLHAIRLTGDLVDGNQIDSRRYDPAARLGATALYALPRGIDIGLAVSVDCLLRNQLYKVGTEEILTIPRIQVLTHLIVGIRL